MWLRWEPQNSETDMRMKTIDSHTVLDLLFCGSKIKLQIIYLVRIGMAWYQIFGLNQCFHRKK